MADIQSIIFVDEIAAVGGKKEVEEAERNLRMMERRNYIYYKENTIYDSWKKAKMNRGTGDKIGKWKNIKSRGVQIPWKLDNKSRNSGNWRKFKGKLKE